MRFTLDVFVHRGAVVEARHRLECAVVDTSGRTLAAAGSTAMARGCSRPATAPASGTDGERGPARIHRAMSGFPLAVEGRGRLRTEWTAAGQGTLVANGGADGRDPVGHSGAGLGAAIRSEDGAGARSGPRPTQ